MPAVNDPLDPFERHLLRRFLAVVGEQACLPTLPQNDATLDVGLHNLFRVLESFAQDQEEGDGGFKGAGSFQSGDSWSTQRNALVGMGLESVLPGRPALESVRMLQEALMQLHKGGELSFHARQTLSCFCQKGVEQLA